MQPVCVSLFFCAVPPPTQTYTLSLHDALPISQQLEGFHRGSVGDRPVLGAAKVSQPGVFWAHTGIVQPRGDRVGGTGLAVLVLQQVTARTMEDPGLTGRQRGRVPLGGGALTGRLTADQAHPWIVEDDRKRDVN